MKWRKFKPINNERSQRVRSLVSRHIDQLAIETHCIDLLTCRSQSQCLALLEYQLSMITLMNPIYPWWLSVITIERVQFQWPNRIIPTVLQNKTLNQIPLVNRKYVIFAPEMKWSHVYFLYTLLVLLSIQWLLYMRICDTHNGSNCPLHLSP